LDPFDLNFPFNEVKYNLLIVHDNSKERIFDKFTLNFLNTKYEIADELEINTWKLKGLHVINYYGRVKVVATVIDPNNIKLPPFESGGFSLDMDEETNINNLKSRIDNLLKQFLTVSFFLNFRTRLDYINLFKKENPEQKQFFSI